MVVNMNMRGSGEGNINQYLSDTIASIFSTVYTADVKGSTNRELFASDNTQMLEVFQQNTAQLENAGSYLMTDDKAPVELLGMQVIDQLIQDEVAYYKDIYEREGISGLLNSL